MTHQKMIHLKLRVPPPANWEILTFYWLLEIKNGFDLNVDLVEKVQFQFPDNQ